MKQGTLFQVPTLGEEMRDSGMQKALDSANSVDPEWGKKAYTFLSNYLGTIKKGHHFMMEDVRKKALGIVPIPPSLRAWGSITVKAKNQGLIQCAGTRPVTNPTAHRAFATVWEKL